MLKRKRMFQQDGYTKHNSKRAASWFQNNKINVMDQPAQFLDLNPIENPWADIKNAVSVEKKQKQEVLRHYGMLSNRPGLKYLFTGARSWSTPYNTDVK